MRLFKKKGNACKTKEVDEVTIELNTNNYVPYMSDGQQWLRMYNEDEVAIMEKKAYEQGFQEGIKSIDNEKIEKALEFAWRFGQIAGDHHRLWVIDQMVRALCGNEEEYTNWVERYETPYGEDYWSWDVGIAP